MNQTHNRNPAIKPHTKPLMAPLGKYAHGFKKQISTHWRPNHVVSKQVAGVAVLMQCVFATRRGQQQLSTLCNTGTGQAATT